MSNRILFAAACLTGVLGACSKPAGKAAAASDSLPTSTDIAKQVDMTAVPKTDASATVNEKTRHSPHFTANRPSGAPQVSDEGKEAAPLLVRRQAAAFADVNPEGMQVTTTYAPQAPTLTNVALGSGQGTSAAIEGENGEHGNGGYGNRPRPRVIILRGGMGGPDDDCDLDRPSHGRIGTGGGPAAVHRVARPMGRIR